MAALALAAAALLTAANSPAATLTWDAGNTTNGATIDAASGSWNLTYPVTNFTATTSTTATTNVNLVAGGLDWFQVNVPANAVAATNSLLYATNLPVNVWFSLTQTTNNVGDTLLLAGVTSGVSVLTTNLASVPTNIVPGGTYYIGIDNSANIDPVGYALQVDLSLTNAVIGLATNLNWNTGSTNTRWTQTSTTVGLNGATFAGTDGAAGDYQIALDGPQIAVTNLIVSANGYVFSGAGLYLASTNLFVADGKTVTFNNNIINPNNPRMLRLGGSGAPSTMIVNGNFVDGQPVFTSTNGSAFYLNGVDNPRVTVVNANVYKTNGTMTLQSSFAIGRKQAASPQPNNGTGALVVDGPSTVLDQNKEFLIIGRGADGRGTLSIQNGAWVKVSTGGTPPSNKALCLLDSTGAGNSNSLAVFNMYGGILDVGSASATDADIRISGHSSVPGQIAMMTQTGGVITVWGGIRIGGANTNAVGQGGTATLTNSGGILYIGSGGGSGIRYGAFVPPTNNISFSGGTVGALQSWISSVPITLGTLNGNITFQCADAGAASKDISLSGALTGSGGLNKTGGGTLTLSGANNYAGSTVVSNGVLKIVPLLSPTNGSLTLDGSAGSPTLNVAPTSAGQFMTVNGNLTYAAGTVTANFDFGALPPSTNAAPIQVANNVTCTVTPDITIAGSAIAVGTYPLIQYGGTVSGTLPATPTVLPAATTGYITNIIGTKIIALVVTASPVSASMTWRVGSGGWGLSLAAQNWTLFGSPVVYTEPNAVQLDDTATGPFPVTITNVTAVNPTAITVLGTNVWTIAGNGGAIDGPASLTKAGSGTLTLSGTNSYSIGTTVSGGQLNINNGGNSAANSAIGTGPLTLGLNAKLDNTSGQSVTLQPTIAQNWQDDWTYVGSTNLNTGSGAVTLGSSVVVLTVSNNVLEVGGAISDGGNTYKLQKAGSGTLTLATDNTFAGGMQLDSGLLQLKTAGGLGTAAFTISGSASVDNLSGADMTLGGITSIALPGGGATFTYLGTSNSLDFGTVPVNQNVGGLTFINVVSNTLTCGGNFTSGNNLMVKIGKGTLVLTNSGVSQFVGTVNEGELTLAHDASFNPAIGTGDSGNGILVQSNAVAKITGSSGNQIPNSVDTRLSSGGIFDLNGNSETIGLLRMTNGVVRNGLAASASILTIANGNGAILASTNNVFDVSDAAASLSIAGNVTGPGSLVKTGAGAVTVQGTNTYTGDTTVLGGTLTINTPSLATTSTVTVTNGVLNLNFAGAETNTVAALVLNGISKPAGIYDATTDPLYLAGSGKLLIVAAPPLINPLPGTIQVSVGVGTLTLSWPTNLGWILQSQTNALNVGLVASSNAWFSATGSELVTTTNLPIDNANPTVFYRLVYP